MKPDPALFIAAQEALGFPKDRCLIVEDSENGTIAALLPDKIACRADNPRANAAKLKNMLHHMCNGGFSVCARDAYKGEFF